MITTIDKEADFTGAVALKKETRGMLFALSINPVVPKGNRYKPDNVYLSNLAKSPQGGKRLAKRPMVNLGILQIVAMRQSQTYARSNLQELLVQPMMNCYLYFLSCFILQ